jgi:hypothetical protein
MADTGNQSSITRRALLKSAFGAGVAAASGGSVKGLGALPLKPLDFPVQPYIDYQGQLAPLMPFRPQSFYLQPWRGYLETVPAAQFLNGIGINYNLPAGTDDNALLAYLAGAGIRTIRVEVPWTIVPWTEDQLDNAERLGIIFSACFRLGIMPIILLNANDGAPCPHQDSQHVVTRGADTGERALQLNVVNDLVEGRSGITGLFGGPMAGYLFTEINQATQDVTLSRPLPKPLPSGTPVTVSTLKYAPLYPVGTPQFADTSAGWLRYIELVCRLLNECSIKDCVFEVWNELSFGSAFTQINNYYSPPLINSSPDFLNPGGCCWDLARQTQILVSQLMPQAQMIWGFSNTTFYHTAIKNLPPGFAGQSYHPYGTGKETTPKDFPDKSRYSWFIEGYIPQGLTKCMPEGWAHLGIQTEQIIRLLYPPDRLTTFPPQSAGFHHYMTEHGFVPAEAGITDPLAAQEYKAKCTLRALLFWLNKGINRLAIYCAYDSSDTGMGLLPASLSPLTDSPSFAMLRRLTDQFQGAEPLAKTNALQIDVTAVGAQPVVFAGDKQHPSLPYREMFTFLPFQVNKNKFVCGFYLMSYDITHPPPAMAYRVMVTHPDTVITKASIFEPLSGRSQEIKPLENHPGKFIIRLHADEIPRLLIFESA